MFHVHAKLEKDAQTNVRMPLEQDDSNTFSRLIVLFIVQLAARGGV